jgi:regulator of protease activity HflC (stomatin/prohibitin superfamily)
MTQAVSPQANGTGAPTTTAAPAAAAPPPQPAAPPPPEALQLIQVRVPLDEAGEALGTPDEAGRLPIVVLPVRRSRLRNDLVAIGAAIMITALLVDARPEIRAGVLTLGAVVIAFGVFRSLRIPVPEGAQAVLLQRGKYFRTLEPGIHMIAPWILVSHVVTTRETPFDAPAKEIPTRDNVRTNVDIMLTFTIRAPERFVFTISAPDFDQVCQASCQEAIRLLLRERDSDEVLELGQTEEERLRADVATALAPYGIEVVRVVILHVVPPVEFMASRENRRLAMLQRAEEEEKHALAMLRQSDAAWLERQKIASRRDAIELEAANETTRLERLASRMQRYPAAMRWDIEGQRLEIARALAGNTRAMVQVGQGTDVAAALLAHTLAAADDIGTGPGTGSGTGSTDARPTEGAEATSQVGAAR